MSRRILTNGKGHYQWRQNSRVESIDEDSHLMPSPNSSSRKTLLLMAKHLKSRLAYFKSNLEYGNEYWNSVLWSDETKLELFGHMNSHCVWMKSNEVHKLFPLKKLPKIKHSGANIILYGCFTLSGPGGTVREQGISDKDQHLSILKNNIKQSARNFWAFTRRSNKIIT